MRLFDRIFPWAMVAVGLLYCVFFFIPRDDEEGAYNLSGFGEIPVIHQGRFMPLDTVARINLLHLSGGRQTWTDENDTMQPATRWLLDTMSGRAKFDEAFLAGAEQRTIKVTHPGLMKILQLEPQPDNLYPLIDFLPEFERLRQIARDLERRSAETRDSLQTALVETFPRIRERYEELTAQAFNATAAAKHKVFRIENEEVLSLLGLTARPRFRYSLNEFAGNLKEFYVQVERARGVAKQDKSLYDIKLLELDDRLSVYGRLVQGIEPLAIPTKKAGEAWKAYKRGSTGKYENAYGEMLRTYDQGNVDEFNKAVSTYQSYMESEFPDESSDAALESAFTYASPFFHCQHLYLLVLMLGCLSWLAWSEGVRKAGLYLAVFTFVVHTSALLLRMYLHGRPPVTNLYSSAIFIGWGAVLAGIVLDFIFRNGIGVVAAGVNGYLTLLVAHYLSLNGDTLESVQAVLDTNLWLSTHVTTVTLGYTACFVAGSIGVVYILLGLFTNYMNAERTMLVNKMLYGTVCFGMFFSFVGTVLGGIWADQSWGRFWGWDPKENGALLIVLWCALILHARWGGMVKLRGMAMLAVGGNIVTAWSWFGTNMLGVGLHSYGFVPERLIWMAVFVGSQLLIIIMAAIPLGLWRSYYRPPTARRLDPNPESRLPVGV